MINIVQISICVTNVRNGPPRWTVPQLVSIPSAPFPEKSAPHVTFHTPHQWNFHYQTNVRNVIMMKADVKNVSRNFQLVN